MFFKWSVMVSVSYQHDSGGDCRWDALWDPLSTVWLHWMAWGGPGHCVCCRPLDVGPGCLRVKMSWTVSVHAFILSAPDWMSCDLLLKHLPPDLPGVMDYLQDLWAKINTLSPKLLLVRVFLPQKQNGAVLTGQEGATRRHFSPQESRYPLIVSVKSGLTKGHLPEKPQMRHWQLWCWHKVQFLKAGI